MGQTNTTCGSNMWGPDCKSVCGYCNPMGQDAGKQNSIVISFKYLAQGAVYVAKVSVSSS